MDRRNGSRKVSKQVQKSQTISARVATEGLIASIHELSHNLRALQQQNSQLRFRQEVLFGLWISSRQAVRVLQTSLWPSGDQLKQLLESPVLNAGVELEEAMLRSIGGCTGADPLQPYMPQRPSPGCSQELILSLIDSSNITGLSEASLLGGTPASLMLAVLLCLTYDPDLVSTTMKAQEPGSKHLVMEHYDRIIREVKDLLAALHNPQQSASCYKELLMALVVKLILAAAGAVMGILQFPACGVNSYVFTTEEKYLPPDALLDR
jgi:hypothetical protein